MSNVEGGGSVGVLAVGGGGGRAGVAEPVGATEARAEAGAYGVAAPDMVATARELERRDV
jgi:hypothetical protein